MRDLEARVEEPFGPKREFNVALSLRLLPPARDSNMSLSISSHRNGNEYGFWSNINPEVPHRRWSQATERHYTTGFPGTRLDTQRMNGYDNLVDYMYGDSIEDPQIYF